MQEQNEVKCSHSGILAIGSGINLWYTLKLCAYNPSMADKLEGIDISNLASMETMKVDINNNTGKYLLPTDIIAKLQASDVTSITDITKEMAEYMFTQMTPSIIAKITDGIDTGINNINDYIPQLEQAIAGMEGVPARQDAVEQMKNAKLEMTDTVDKMTTLEEAIPAAFDTGKDNYLKEIEDRRSTIENEFQLTLNKGFKQIYSTVAIASLLALIVMIFYKEEKRAKNSGSFYKL